MSTTTGTTGWYTNAYSGSFRSSRLRAPSLLPGSRRPFVVPVQQTVVVDVAHAATTTDADGNKGIKRRETIFGPDVGEDDEPGWTDQKREEVGIDKIKGWVEKTKSEEGLHPTTTLQALVNLKRPTLLLQQLVPEEPPRNSADLQEEDIVSAAPKGESYMPPNGPLHLLKFNYDATTPQVRIILEWYPTPQPPIEGKESIVEDHEPKLVYSGLHAGGFGQTFSLPHHAALDLSTAIVERDEEAIKKSMENKRDLEGTAPAVPPPGISSEQPQANDTTENLNEVNGTEGNQASGMRRFNPFRRNRNEEDLEAGMSGIELTNTNAGVNAAGETQQEGEKKEKEIEQGMRLLIRIDGLGPEGHSLKRVNAQLTHILISGTWVADKDAGVGANGAQAQAGKRVWVVKVARREAVIGHHTFLLKEIYGLSSTSTQSSTSYPPAQDDPYASTPNECIVCLTSPRDVVLLPCRHLVVCRDCAVGMVEYGAGGKVARRDEGTGEATGEGGDAAGATAGVAGASATPAPQVAGGTTTGGRERRKKKVKGWYCPVCRQPYTSLLRLALPESDKPATNELSRVPSRAASVRTTRSLRAPSIAPTLPDGAERMLDSLRPAGARDDEDEYDEEVVDSAGIQHSHEVERPQFVVGEDHEDKEQKVHTEHREVVTPSSEGHVDAAYGAPALAPPVDAAVGREGEHKEREEGKGWKEVA
ncbi:hypothetical protein IAU60_003304 [Kwoniella sp. DSM 27419]